MKVKNSKKGQIFIFIVIAIVIVLSVVIYLILRPSAKNISVNSENINEYMEKCASDSVLQALTIILPDGGKINPENYVLYKGNKIEYLCYQSNWYLPCLNQEPLLIKHFEEEIKNYVSPRIDSCFANVKTDMEKAGYTVDMQGNDINVSFYPKQIIVNMEKSINMEKTDERKKYENFSSLIVSPTYELLGVAMDIINGEARDCDFDYSSYEHNYPSVNIDRVFTGDSTQVYTLQNEEKMMFAVRSCALPGAF